MTDQFLADGSDVSEQLFVLNETRVARHALVIQLAEDHLLFGRKDVVEVGVCGYRRRIAVLRAGDNRAESAAKENQEGEDFSEHCFCPRLVWVNRLTILLIDLAIPP